MPGRAPRLDGVLGAVGPLQKMDPWGKQRDGNGIMLGGINLLTAGNRASSPLTSIRSSFPLLKPLSNTRSNALLWILKDLKELTRLSKGPQRT